MLVFALLIYFVCTTWHFLMPPVAPVILLPEHSNRLSAVEAGRGLQRHLFKELIRGMLTSQAMPPRNMTSEVPPGKIRQEEEALVKLNEEGKLSGEVKKRDQSSRRSERRKRDISRKEEGRKAAYKNVRRSRAGGNARRRNALGGGQPEGVLLAGVLTRRAQAKEPPGETPVEGETPGGETQGEESPGDGPPGEKPEEGEPPGELPGQESPGEGPSGGAQGEESPGDGPPGEKPEEGEPPGELPGQESPGEGPSEGGAQGEESPGDGPPGEKPEEGEPPRGELPEQESPGEEVSEGGAQGEESTGDGPPGEKPDEGEPPGGDLPEQELPGKRPSGGGLQGVFFGGFLRLSLGGLGGGLILGGMVTGGGQSGGEQLGGILNGLGLSGGGQPGAGPTGGMLLGGMLLGGNPCGCSGTHGGSPVVGFSGRGPSGGGQSRGEPLGGGQRGLLQGMAPYHSPPKLLQGMAPYHSPPKLGPQKPTPTVSSEKRTRQKPLSAKPLKTGLPGGRQQKRKSQEKKMPWKQGSAYQTGKQKKIPPKSLSKMPPVKTLKEPAVPRGFGKNQIRMSSKKMPQEQKRTRNLPPRNRSTMKSWDKARERSSEKMPYKRPTLTPSGKRTRKVNRSGEPPGRLPTREKAKREYFGRRFTREPGRGKVSKKISATNYANEKRRTANAGRRTTFGGRNSSRGVKPIRKFSQRENTRPRRKHTYSKPLLDLRGQTLREKMLKENPGKREYSKRRFTREPRRRKVSKKIFATNYANEKRRTANAGGRTTFGGRNSSRGVKPIRKFSTRENTPPRRRHTYSKPLLDLRGQTLREKMLKEKPGKREYSKKRFKEPRSKVNKKISATNYAVEPRTANAGKRTLGGKKSLRGVKPIQNLMAPFLQRGKTLSGTKQLYSKAPSGRDLRGQTPREKIPQRGGRNSILNFWNANNRKNSNPIPGSAWRKKASGRRRLGMSPITGPTYWKSNQRINKNAGIAPRGNASGINRRPTYGGTAARMNPMNAAKNGLTRTNPFGTGKAGGVMQRTNTNNFARRNLSRMSASNLSRRNTGMITGRNSGKKAASNPLRNTRHNSKGNVQLTSRRAPRASARFGNTFRYMPGSRRHARRMK